MRSDSDPAARTAKMVSDGGIQVHRALRECIGYTIKNFSFVIFHYSICRKRCVKQDITIFYSGTKADKVKTVLKSACMVSCTNQCVFVYLGSPTDGKADGWEVVG